MKKWLCSFFQIRRGILNVHRESPLNRLVFLDSYGTPFKGFDYYYCSKLNLSRYVCIPNTFPALKQAVPFFREKYGLSHAPVFTCPASACNTKRQLLFIRHVKQTKLDNIVFLFLVPQRNSYAEQMEQAIGDDPRFRILYNLPRPEVEAAIMESAAVFPLLLSGAAAALHSGGYVVRHPMVCSRCGSRFHPEGRHHPEKNHPLPHWKKPWGL